MNLVWLRNDLRLDDNPALFHARQSGPACCVYTVTPNQWSAHDDAPAKLALWRARLIELAKELKSKNIPLKLISHKHYQGIDKKLLSLAIDIGAEGLWFNHEYPLNEKQRDQQVSTLFEANSIAVHRFHGDIIHEPGSVRTQTGNIYHVYSPFARQWRKQINLVDIEPLSAPRKQTNTTIASDDIEKIWTLNDSYRDDLWPVSTKEINKRLDKFTANSLSQYKALRDIPSIAGTSTLSPYLACGAVSVRHCIAAARRCTAEWLDNSWVNELTWREFYRHLTSCYPHLSRSENFKATAKPIPWENDDRHWQAWCTGTTGFPIVDAAMRQLIQTGWMHNRLRMVVAAFLSKLLLIDWRKGEQFFMLHLLDGDYASNNGGWQWAASTGADAAPYFRIFNPLRQSEKFDSEGKFIKKLLPELSELDKKSIHNPSSKQREDCGYPQPVIDYKFARQKALDGYAKAMGKN
ncbi:MAG: FAD-binding domain-containing protein [Pseudomonadota bacterium]